ncbi:glycoside hydrolase family 38 C-terminal domain-containing protein [Pedobacter nyackensis]|uniref:Glycosyl hydrolases family 38 C-terminal domain-containing protein n=1 Tax=Pedobacter nyackensis TaxID=475255 RepID=A0A1W2EIF7_9SPHI|nr:glycoside hydrolase family 38 C-terminal domain-containing protein [Pedobacter nyackensis]SMD09116.1 Glycosyl hydrolases family 38 C-terminal domain-containing protein [Pedobacter nyackensis]
MKRFLFGVLLFLLISTSIQAQTNHNKVKEVIVVFKTHFDIGYTDWSDNVRYNYANSMIISALNTVDKSNNLPKDQQFKWTISGWPMKEILSKAKPDVKLRVERAIKSGSFFVHALPFSMETESSDLEPLVQSLGYASKISREAGLPLPIDAKASDVPSHSWILPTLLNNAGAKFLHIGCNPASRSPEVPLLFWWEGPDKSKLMTFYYGEYYGTSPAPPKDWAHSTWLAIIQSNDNHGAPTYEEYRAAVKNVEKLNPGAKVRVGSMADFYNTIIKENPKLITVKGDMPDTWIHGYMSMPREMKSSRALSKSTLNLEAFSTLSTIWGRKPEEPIHTLIDQSIAYINLFDEHTWGLAMSHGRSGYWAYGKEFEKLRAKGYYDDIEYSWKEKGNYINGSEKLILPTLNRELKRLATSVNVAGNRIVVYNPLPWERNDMVTIQTGDGFKKSLKNVATGEVVKLVKNKNILQFQANRIPAMGYTTFVSTDEEGGSTKSNLSFDVEKAMMENEFFKITFDKQSGTIKSLIDKKSNKEMVNTNADFKFGQYVNERFAKTQTDKYAKDYIKAGWNWAYAELGRINLDDTPYKKSSGKNAEIEFSKDALSVTAIMTFKGDADLVHNYSMVFTLYENKPTVEVIWSINGKPADPWPEGGWISFPFNIENAQFKVGRLGAVLDPAKDFVKGSNLDYGFITTGVGVLDKKNQGFGITSPDVPGVSLDRPGLWKYSTDFVPQRGNVFFNLYNNQWSTNFTEWVEGSWTAKFYIWSIDHYTDGSSIVMPSEEIRNPLMVAFTGGEAGKQAASLKGVSVSEKGVLVTFFGKNRDGEGDVIRLWEQNGKTSACRITLPVDNTYKSVQPCNLRGEKTGKEISIKNNAFEVKLNANQPASFILI